MSLNRVNKKFLSDVDTRDLIKEIRNRPGLYDTSVLEQPRRDHKQQLWQEVGERLTDTDMWESYTPKEREARLEEIREKWRHLKNNFLREIKCMRSGEKKRKYIFFDDMEFMTPFVGIKIRGPTKLKRDRDDNSDAESTTDERKLRNPNKIRRPLRYEDSSVEYADESDLIQEQFDAIADSNDEQEEQDSKQRQMSRSRVTSSTKPTKQSPASNSSPPKQKLTKEQEMIIKRFDIIKKMPRKIITLPGVATSTAAKPANLKVAAGQTRHVVAATGNPNRLSLRFFDMRDSDISFCMSMVSTFRKMGEAKKLRAKIDMLKVLHKYAEDLDETPKTRGKTINQQQRQRTEVLAKSSVPNFEEDFVENVVDDHSMDNGTDVVKSETKINDTPNNVWWT